MSGEAAEADLEADRGAGLVGLEATAAHVFGGVAGGVSGAIGAASDVGAAFDLGAAFGVGEAGAI